MFIIKNANIYTNKVKDQTSIVCRLVHYNNIYKYNNNNNNNHKSTFKETNEKKMHLLQRYCKCVKFKHEQELGRISPAQLCVCTRIVLASLPCGGAVGGEL